MSPPPSPAAPTTSGDSVNTRPWSQTALTHTQAHWEALHPELERLYVKERRKLHEIMQYMQTKHGFKATTQMYKKRFAKWGFQKNKKRWATADPALSVLNLSCSDTDVKFMFLASVRTWNDAFYEEPHRHVVAVAPTVEANEISFAFKMITELLDRGYGELAGRVARKAFLLIEKILNVDGPAVVWNLLEIMHNIAVAHLACTNPDMEQHATQLFNMLLVHIDALVVNTFNVSETHPLPTILRLLKRLAAESKTQKDGATHYPINPHTTTLLEQAWGLNAKLMFDNFDPSLLHVYWYLAWDSCSINLPPHVVNVILRRLRQMGLDYGERSTVAAAKPILTIPVRKYLQSVEQWNSGNPPHTRHFLPLVPACTGKFETQSKAGSVVGKLTTNILHGLREYGKQVPLGVSGAIDEQGNPLRVCEMLRSTTDQTALLGTLTGLLATKALADFESEQRANKETWECPQGYGAAAEHLSVSLPSSPKGDTSDEDAQLTHPRPPAIQAERIQAKIEAMTTAWAIRISMTRDANLTSKPKPRASTSTTGNKTRANTDELEDGDDANPSRIDSAQRTKHIRKLITLQEQARGKINLHVVREMWALEDELKAIGESAQAKETNREWRRRLETYLGDIPVQAA